MPIYAVAIENSEEPEILDIGKVFQYKEIVLIRFMRIIRDSACSGLGCII